ncbi:MAG TPA: type II toxin-antitoxin system Phd/YefM family antitoxin [Gemmatimonadales bacterium]|nr:type II toxin-antitoxin system Phd/YefM family antitoxin [Gemmatimonadales bacterium]
MGVVTVHYAKTNLSRLIKRALAGEEIIIARGRQPVLRLIPIARPKVHRKFGAMRGQAKLTAAFFKPMTRAELKLWYGE